MPVALHCMGPVGDLVVELHRLPVPDHVVTTELVDLGPGVGHSVPLLYVIIVMQCYVQYGAS